MDVFSNTYGYFHTVKTGENELIWEEHTSFPFNELIISWNALRPKKGLYRLSASVKDENGWSPWLLYAEWRKSAQKTFAKAPKASVASSYQDVIRLRKHRVANAFRIRIQSPKEGLDTLSALYAAVSNLDRFAISPIASLDSYRLPLKSLYSQMALKHPRCKDLCSPTSVCMAIDYLLSKRATNPIDFAKRAHDRGFDIYGNWALNVAESYQWLNRGYYCTVSRLPHFEALHSYLKRDLPVIVSVQGPLPGAPTPFSQGHLLLVYGWDSKAQRVLCADPAFPTDSQTLTSYPIQDFLAAWGRRQNLSYLFWPKEASLLL